MLHREPDMVISVVEVTISVKPRVRRPWSPRLDSMCTVPVLVHRLALVDSFGLVAAMLVTNFFRRSLQRCRTEAPPPSKAKLR